MTLAAESEAYDRLAAAILERTPACRGDDRFLVDANPTSVQHELADICNSCGVYDACLGWRQSIPAEKRPGGFLAGLQTRARPGTHTNPNPKEK